MGDVIVSRRDRRRRAVSQRILVSTDLDRLRQCGHRVNGIILSCGSVWACPVCSARIRHARLRDIMPTVEAAGQTVMLTCSLPADETDLLTPLLDMLLRSWSKVINGQPWKRAERQWHIGGFMRVVEATRSVRAWHVRIRVLMTLSARLDESERRAFSAWMDSRWRKATGTFGRFALRFDPVRASIASFVLQEDGAAGGRVTPFRLLDDDGLGLPASERERLWVEYCTATTRRRCFTWSHGADA